MRTPRVRRQAVLVALAVLSLAPVSEATQYTSTPTSPTKLITLGSQSGTYDATSVDADDGTVDATATVVSGTGAATEILSDADERFTTGVGAWTETTSTTVGGTSNWYDPIAWSSTSTASADGTGSGYVRIVDGATNKAYGTATSYFNHDFTVPAAYGAGWTVTASYSWRHPVTGVFGSNTLSFVKLHVTDTSNTVLQTVHTNANGGAGWAGAASNVAAWTAHTSLAVTYAFTAGSTYRLRAQFQDVDTTGSDTPTVDAFVDDVQIAFAPPAYALDAVYRFAASEAPITAEWSRLEIRDAAAGHTAAAAYVRNFATSAWEAIPSWTYSSTEAAHGPFAITANVGNYGSADSPPQIWIRYAWSGASAATPGLSVDALTVTLTRSTFTVYADPVDADGAALAGASWGGWTAVPAGTNVESLNYMKILNDGLNPTQSVIVDFTGASFVGIADAADTVAIDGNVQFAWWEDASGTAAPSSGTYAWGATSASGSATIAFGGLNRVMFVTYRLVAVPAVSNDQAYTASFTVTAA